MLACILLVGQADALDSNLYKTKTDDLKSSALQNWRSEADSNIKPKRLVITDGVPLSPLGGAE